MKIKNYISRLTFKDKNEQLTSNCQLAIVSNEVNEYGVYDYREDKYLIEPCYDNIFEISASAFVVCKKGLQSFWTIREIIGEQKQKKLYEIKEIEELHMDRIYADLEYIVMKGFLAGECFMQIYSMKSDWLSDKWDNISIISSNVILLSDSKHNCLMSGAGEILWVGDDNCILIRTDIIVSEGSSYYLIADIIQGNYLWPVFREYRNYELGIVENKIWKYVRSNQQPKWCEEQQVFCPIQSGNVAAVSCFGGGE